MALKDFKLLGKLGEGAYSVVYKVQRQIDKKQYALKKVKLHNLSQKQQQNALNQVRILASINNMNIIAYKQAFLQNGYLCIVMEFADDGDLYEKIVNYKKQNKKFQQNEIWNVMLQICRGLKALHSHQIFHRDLKSANVFLTKQNIPKLGDMNVSKVSKNGLLYTQTGTPYYASPEVWRDKPYNTKSDIWSLGCVIYQMCTLKPPFRSEDMQGLYKKVLKGAYQKISGNYSTQLSLALKMMLQVNSELRPSSQELLKKFENKILQLNLPKQNLENNELLKTIRIPHKLQYLTDRLPKNKYDGLRRQNIKTQCIQIQEKYNIMSQQSQFLKISNMINSKRYKQLYGIKKISNENHNQKYRSVQEKKSFGRYKQEISELKIDIKKQNLKKRHQKQVLHKMSSNIKPQYILPPIK